MSSPTDIVAHDPKYINVRQKAYELDSELEQAEEQYQKEALILIKKLQQKFYRAYGDKIHELEDLQDAIQQYQNKGLKKLKRDLQKMYLEEVETDDSSETTMVVGRSRNQITISKNLQQKAKKLYEDYRAQYCPDDDYQRKKDQEASKLQRAILGGDKHNMMII